jgi:hypothetical protein
MPTTRTLVRFFFRSIITGTAYVTALEEKTYLASTMRFVMGVPAFQYNDASPYYVTDMRSF